MQPTAVFVAIIGIVLKGLGLAHTWRRGSTMLRNTVADSEHGELLPSAHSAPQMRSEVTNEIIRIGILVVMVVSFMVKGGVG